MLNEQKKYSNVIRGMAQYKIKDLEILSGIKAHTIRIWEKRYGLLEPERSETQIRYYTDVDLQRLMNISILYKNGHKISKIAELSEEEICSIISKIKENNHCCDTDVSLLIESAVGMKCLSFNQILEDIIVRKGTEEAFRSCIFDFITKIESLWRVKKITHAQKHFVYNRLRQRLITEIELLPEVPSEEFEVLLFTPEGEYNELDLLYFYYQLRGRGRNAVYLGVNLPIHKLENTLDEFKPLKIVTSINENLSEVEYKKHLDELEKISQIPIYIGGGIVNKYGFHKHKNIYPFSELIK